jgi:hypothetical protein
MPTFDIEFRVDYRRTVRIDASDEDAACEQAEDLVRSGIPREADRTDVDLYGTAEVKSEEDL